MSEEIQRLFIEAKKEMEMPKEELLEKLWDLEQRISDAIDFIMQPNIEIREYHSCDMDYVYVSNELLEILKGKENN